MTDNITGKTILLTCISFYNYDIALRDTLLQLGAKEVILINLPGIEASFRNEINLRIVVKKLVNPKLYRDREKKTDELIRQIDKYTFDIFLCIEYMSFSKRFFSYLKKKNPNVKTFLFLWDTFAVQQPRYKDFLPYFDYAYSFDKDDAIKYGMMYYPDFYVSNGTGNEDIEYDIAFVGVFHYLPLSKDRARLLYHVHKFCEQYKLKSYLYLLAKKRECAGKIRNLYWKLLDYREEKECGKYSQYGYIHYEKLPLEEVDRVYNASRVILDLNFKNRQGMTINVLTALAKGKKLITTNKKIREESFYDPDTIYIFDDENPVLDIDFFKRSGKRYNMECYRLDNWLKHILNDVE